MPSLTSVVPKHLRVRSLLACLLMMATLAGEQGLCAAKGASQEASDAFNISLNGAWETGLERNYRQQVSVPGLAGDPASPSSGTLWYRRAVHLPKGDWTQATLLLKGARFAPKVYVNGVQASGSGGGMAPTVHLLRSTDVKPDADIVLEVALQSESTLDPADASMVPQADRWRSDNSSGLWDDVILHLSGNTRLTRVTPFTDWKLRKLTLHYAAVTEGAAAGNRSLRATLLDRAGREVASSAATPLSSEEGTLTLSLTDAVTPWSPSHPEMYTLRVMVLNGSHVLDRYESPWGLKEFTATDRRFYLNGSPIELRGGTVVWHRFLRDPQAGSIAWNIPWFATNVVQRLQGYGANFLRFHLGSPPERLLDLCDKSGMMVQLEWPFFHGVKASDASMREQWRAWLDLAMRHPSVVIVHPWNETDGDELKAAWAAMNAVLVDYPPLVIGHRDTLHIHKYWWSLFENLGLYYDSAEQFDRTVMVDEFGGNYLDLNGDAGTYPAVKETFLRFLGRDQTRASRLEFHAESNARVAEYWRRIGAAGIAPFCLLSSPQDGNSWFLGKLQDPEPMPVWGALAAAMSPQSVSLDLWDRNFLPGEATKIPIYFFNDRDMPAELSADIEIKNLDAPGAVVVSRKVVSALVPAHGRTRTMVELQLPRGVGNWQLAAVLRNHVPGVTHPIVSSWDVRTVDPIVPKILAAASVAVPEEESELKAFLQRNGVKTVDLGDSSAKVVLTGAKSWDAIAKTPLRKILADAEARGQSIVMLDIGPRDLGVASRGDGLVSLDEAPRIKPGDGYTRDQDLFAGIHVRFRQVAEPESHLQPGENDDSLWAHLPRQATWLWNGLRGGLTAPAADMEVSGVGSQGFLAEWEQRGANKKMIQTGTYYAYGLAGYYAFSTKPNDEVTTKALRGKVAFLVEDAPALKDVVNPNAPVEQTNLSQKYTDLASEKTGQLIPLSTCGKSLTRTPVMELTFGGGKGNVLLSQVLTAGRLLPGEREPGPYGIRHDPAAEQFVLNMLGKALETQARASFSDAR